MNAMDLLMNPVGALLKESLADAWAKDITGVMLVDMSTRNRDHTRQALREHARAARGPHWVRTKKQSRRRSSKR